MTNKHKLIISLSLVIAAALLLMTISNSSNGLQTEELHNFVSENPNKIVYGEEEIINSNMYELTVSWFDARGMALATIDKLLFVVKPAGELLWIDIDTLSGPYSTSIEVPMNRKILISTEFWKRIPLGWFRITGAYAEPAEAGVRLFVTHHVFAKNCFFLQVSSVDLIFDVKVGIRKEGEWRKVFRPNPCIKIGDASDKSFAGHQAGGKIGSFDRDHLLVSYGDHEIDGMKGAHNSPQDPRSPYGKIWKIKKDDTSSEVYATGIRNPQGLFIDEHGDIWESEHGPQGGDELNLIIEDKNYGWPIQSYGVMYGNYEVPLNLSQGRHSAPEYEPPVFAWVPSIGPSNLTKIKGPKFPLWAGDLLLATLNNKALRRLRIIDKHVVYDERIEIGERLRDIVALDDGRIAVLSDSGSVGLIDDTGRKLKPLH